MKARKLPGIIFIVACLIFACTKEEAPPPADSCDTVPKAYSSNVSPIIQSSCAISGCHDAGSFNGPGPLLDHSQIFAARSQIRAAVSSGAMPQNTTLSTAQKNAIICWIDSGAPNN